MFLTALLLRSTGDSGLSIIQDKFLAVQSAPVPRLLEAVSLSGWDMLSQSQTPAKNKHTNNGAEKERCSPEDDDHGTAGGEKTSLNLHALNPFKHQQEFREMPPPLLIYTSSSLYNAVSGLFHSLPPPPPLPLLAAPPTPKPHRTNCFSEKRFKEWLKTFALRAGPRQPAVGTPAYYERSPGRSRPGPRGARRGPELLLGWS